MAGRVWAALGAKKFLLAACVLAGGGVLSAQDSAAQTNAPAAVADPGVAVDRFEYQYGLEHPELPAIEQLNRVSVRLARDAGGVWRVPDNGSAGEIVTLGEIPAGSHFDAPALRQVAQELVRWYNARDLYGVWVAFSELEATTTGITDRRAADDRVARLKIWASQVAEVRTLARGKRFKPQDSINNRRHRGVIIHSPLHAAQATAPGSLFHQRQLNEYLHGLSLHPGRLVEASIASAGEPGKVVLDFLVNESRPWQIFSQVTNFGTDATGVWRGRVGFQDNQLTNHDDILNIDAISTPDFKTYGSFLSYRIPIIRPAVLLARVYASYGDFLASDVAIQSLRYAGRNWLGGVEFTNRLALPRDWELLTALGANFTHYGIQSSVLQNSLKVPLVTGSSDFLIPFLSTTLSRSSPWWSVAGSLRYDQTVGDFANLDATTGIPSLGRANADAEWSSVRWSLSGSIYLEPIFNGGDANARYLANQLSVRVRGRVLMKGSRLIPHEQEPIGGAFSVRGYAESVLSADEFVAGSIEYAFHLPRVLTPGEQGKLFKQPFRWRPKGARQEPDWDLIGRAFFDYAYRQVSHLPLEQGQTVDDLDLVERNVSIAGAGAGIELQVKQNLSVRCDVGVSLTELRDDTREVGQQLVVPAGDVRYYISSSFSW